ncbi:SDR family oxidoreductase [Alkalibacter rhizosphaerae]|uniref:SDR family oxidoreductase n=1 Tax=Alkalibacter rhizosphaerae TaxID=2815577 RepID=A0A975AGS1_9FIRM|nr:SDR family oxidoreductase [Alkalibacter rhizosphaerae]QSX07672.1 SDR family oxidoreductase [Alkalibacter rhizosphaerae]
MSFNRFIDKIVLVIGAGAGMGKATAMSFLAEGAQVIGLDMFEDRLEALVDETKDLGGTLDTYVGDITDMKTIDGVVDFIQKKYGTLDILAHVAGIMDFMLPPDMLTDDIWDRVMDVNVKAQWRMAKAAMPLMKNHEGNGACVTIVSSLGGYVGSSSGSAYITSKHGVEGLMKNLSFSYRDNKVRFNCVAPGAIATEIMETTLRIFPEYEEKWESGMCSEGMEFYLLNGIGLVRPVELGEAQDVADAILFLSSDQAKFINGASLVVDGGWYSA